MTAIRRWALILMIASSLYVAGWLSSQLWAYREFPQVRLCAPAGLNAHDAALFASIWGWLAFFVSPYFEELVFRRFLFAAASRVALARMFPAASALLFALAHLQYYVSELDLVSLIQLAFRGFVYARVYLFRRSVFDSYLAHLATNSLLLVPKDLILRSDSCMQSSMPVALGLLAGAVAAVIAASSRFALYGLKERPTQT